MILEIERRTGLSRKTIRKCLRAAPEEPKFMVPARPRKRDFFAEMIEGRLGTYGPSRAISRAFSVRACSLLTHARVFNALTQVFRVLGGVPGDLRTVGQHINPGRFSMKIPGNL